MTREALKAVMQGTGVMFKNEARSENAREELDRRIHARLHPFADVTSFAAQQAWDL